MKEAGELNNLLSHQQVLFFQKLAIIEEMCQSIDALMNQISDLKTYRKEVEEKISNFIEWKNNFEGRLVNLLKIEES